MDPNSGATPNPLNPEPDAPTNPTPEPLDANPSEPTQSSHGGSLDGMVGTSRPTQEKTVKVTTKPAAPEQEAVSQTEAPVKPVDPMDRPMVVAPDSVAVAKPKKKRTGLIVAILVCLLIAVGCGVAAVLLLLNNKGSDAVKLAMDRLMSGEAPTNVMISGTIEMQIGDESSPFSQIGVDLNSKLITNSAQNSTTATVRFMPQNGSNELSLTVNELTNASGDLFLKLDGISSFVQGMANPEFPEEDVIIEGETDCDNSSNCLNANVAEEPAGASMMGGLASMLSTIENEWLKLSIEEAEGITGSMGAEGPLSCVMDLTSQINTSSSSALELYDKYPFITSTTNNLPVASRKNPIYKLGFDSEKFTKYIDEMQNTELLNSLYNCLGAENNVNISTDDVNEMVAKLPEIYVEIDGKNNFTRVYIESKNECDEDCEEDGEVNDYASLLTVDLDLSYPSSISIVEPNEYTSLTDLIQQMFQNPEAGFDF